MSKTSSIVLLLVFNLTLLNPVLPIAEYLLNKEYITKILCINKDKPDLMCNGKCHLKNELKNVLPKEDPKIPTNERRTQNIESLYFLLPKRIFKLSLSNYVTFCWKYVNSYSYSFSPFTFHPPG